MLKIVYPTYCGIDVHKSFVVVCIASSNKKGVTTYKSHCFSTYTGDLRELLQWLLVQNCLTSSNLQLANVFSDIFGKSTTAILDHLLENPDDTDFDFMSLVDGRCKASSDEIAAAVDGKLLPEQAEQLKVIRSTLTGWICVSRNSNPKAYRLPRNMPTNLTSFVASRVSGPFRCSHYRGYQRGYVCVQDGQASQFLGRAYSSNNESAGKKKPTRVSQAGAYLHPLLVQCANVVITSKKHPEIRNRYLALRKRRGHKKAIIAIARMLHTSTYAILQKDEPYKPEL